MPDIHPGPSSPSRQIRAGAQHELPSSVFDLLPDMSRTAESRRRPSSSCTPRSPTGRATCGTCRRATAASSTPSPSPQRWLARGDARTTTWLRSTRIEDHHHRRRRETPSSIPTKVEAAGRARLGAGYADPLAGAAGRAEGPAADGGRRRRSWRDANVAFHRPLRRRRAPAWAKIDTARGPSWASPIGSRFHPPSQGDGALVSLGPTCC